MKFQKTKERLPTFDDVAELSLDYVRKSEFITRLPRRLMSYFPLFDVNSVNVEVDLDVMKLEKVDLNNIKVVGIDTSIIPIAESVKGVLYAVRGAAVVFDAGDESYSIKVYGPTLVYYTPEVVKYLHRYVKLGLNSLLSSIYDTYIAKKILVTIYEFNILNELVGYGGYDIVIIDGAIESPILRRHLYNELLDTLYQNSVGLVGVSKRSRLIKKYFETMIYLKKFGVDGFVKVDRLNHISSTYVGYFNVKSGMPFRVDISSNTPSSYLNIVYSLPSNGFGYPSVLIEAHTVSKLKYRDVLGLYRVIMEMGGSIKSSITHRSAVIGPLEGGMHETF